jgi:hypothetical protein
MFNRQLSDVSVIKRVEIAGVEVHVTEATVKSAHHEPDLVTISFMPSKLEIFTEEDA